MLDAKFLILVLLGNFLFSSSTVSFEGEACPVAILNPPEINRYSLYTRLSNISEVGGLSESSLKDFAFANLSTRPFIESLACYQNVDVDARCSFWVERDKFEGQKQQEDAKCRLSNKQSPNEVFGILFSQYYILNGIDNRSFKFCEEISVGRFKDISFIQKYVRKNIKSTSIIDTSVGDEFYYGSILKGLVYFIRGMQQDEPGFLQRAKGYFGGVGGSLIVDTSLADAVESDCYDPLKTFGRNARSVANLLRVDDPKMEQSLRDSIIVLELKSIVTNSILDTSSLLKSDIETLNYLVDKYTLQISKEKLSKLPDPEIIKFAYQNMNSSPLDMMETDK